uniref:SLBP_RNA_bind domain-containing protein n=1 Tax=Strongyloides stercoralis TaxID=6248 RepID=A0AAF5CZD4_STRER
MSQKRVITSSSDYLPDSPGKKSRKILKYQTLNDLSNTEVDNHFKLLLENNRKLENESWVDINEREMKEKCINDAESKDLHNSSVNIEKSRKQIAPKKSSTTPRYLRSRAREVKNEEESNRKRRMDRSRSFVKEEISSTNDIEMEEVKSSPKKRICTTRSSFNNNDVKIKEGWSDPKLGWCKDPEVLIRRTREIEKAKEKPVYGEYLEAIPKYERVKGIHPKTPNKFINYSRRSWDAQMKLWKRSLYEFFGRTPGTSCRTTPCISRDASPCIIPSKEGGRETKKETQNIGNVDFSINSIDPDRMASLLSKFEVDSRKKFQDGDDESTLKATTTVSNGPTSFDNII